MFKKIALSLIFFIAIERFAHHQTEGFQTLKIHALPSLASSFEEPLPKELEGVLDQKFTFLQKGGQTYNFVSEDRKIVLKLVKMHHLTTYSFLRYLPLPYHWKQLVLRFVKKHEQKLPIFLKSADLASHRLPGKAGILYFHPNTTGHLHTHITVIDKIHIQHTIDLDTTAFALQHYAMLPEEHFLNLRSHQDVEGMKESIDSLLALIQGRCREGIRDCDPAFKRNCGFLGNTAIDLDLGSFQEDPSVKQRCITQTTLYYDTLPFKRWLAENYPEAAIYLEEQLQVLLT